MTRLLVEDIILQHDRRGISFLRPYLEKNFVDIAAQSIINNPGNIFITTGFYVNGTIETDGPLGTFALGQALKKLGNSVYFISDKYALPFMNLDVGFSKKVIDFPITDTISSKNFAENLLQKYNPSVVISVERCGMTKEGDYKNCRGTSILDQTAKIDYLFDHKNTIGIGDGGNEVGMGKFSKEIQNQLHINPCITTTKHLIISSVSNWGAYGLATSLSNISEKKLLPETKQVHRWLTQIDKLGAVDGFSGKSELKVDGFNFEQTENIINQLHRSL